MHWKLIGIAIVAIIVNINIILLKQKEVQTIKNSKVIIGLLGDEELDKSFEKIVKDKWTFCEIAGSMPRKEAIKKAKKDKNLFVISIAESYSSSSHENAGPSMIVTVKYISFSKRIEINSGSRIKAKTFIPEFEKEGVTEEILKFGIGELQHKLQTMDEEKLSSEMKLNKAYKKNSPKLKDKVLYIPDFWLNHKITEEDVKALYNYPFKIVSYEEWRDAILNNKEGVAYIMISPNPIQGNFVYHHYIVDAKDEFVYADAHPKVSFMAQGHNVSSSNSGYIKKKNLERYNNVPIGKW